MQRSEVTGAVRPIYGSIGVKLLHDKPTVSHRRDSLYLFQTNLPYPVLVLTVLCQSSPHPHGQFIYDPF